MINNENTGFQKMQVQIEELEKRVSTLGKKVKEGANTQELQEQITQAQTDIETMQTNLANATNIATGLQTQVQTNTTNITQNASKTNSNATKITNLTTRISNAETNILALTGGIDVSAELAEIDARLDDIDGDFALSTGDYINLNLELNYFCEQAKSLCYLFSCSQYQRTSLNFKFYLNSDLTTPVNTQINVYINDNLEKSYIYSVSQNLIAEECLYYYTDRRINHIQFEISTNNMVVTLKNVEITATGNNFVFLSDDNNFNITTINNMHYVSYTDGYTLKWGVLSPENLSVTDLPNENARSINCSYYTYKLYKPLKCENNILVELDEEQTTYIIGYEQYGRCTVTGDRRYYSNTNARRINVSMQYCGEYPGEYILLIYKDNRVFIHNNGRYAVKYKNEETKTYLDAIPIEYNYQMVNTAPVKIIHFISLETDGYYYFCHMQSKTNIDYKIKLMRGRFATATLQQDGKVFVYINRGYDIFKIVINKNEDESYVVESISQITKGYKLIECLNNKYILRDKDGLQVITLE